MGNIEEEEGTIEGNIDRHNTNRMQMAVLQMVKKENQPLHIIKFWNV